ncbi:hypothetical protein AAA431_03155 [Lactobacillus crispatus]|jgi:hypothetical protein|uniref:Uncharacterized protein n=1 Tax=Lactobacillus crispatus TaxID=47770 RepID=A0A109DCJ3_9LACO|nr:MULTISPECIES: hypothetical protein [Lactobacillus]CDA27449.1 putative uncharacterized protein [Lactobacillus amylovorus CAG:719]KWU02910.1 hypothetical protein AEL95_10085 [Lactobacillus crispatus]MCT3595101.1 hypothetical protein [Lactobacillus amylovorus]MDB6220695.1 hypothetical protein [Lactobacillus amylovorus]TJY05860.1 hypothetical protein FCF10_01950 [Lactobacillus amylovorus]
MNKHSSVPYVLLIDIEDKLAEIIYEYDAIELTQALAKSVNKEVPVTDAKDPFISSTRDVLRENIDCLSDDEKFEFIAQVQKLSYVKHNSELMDAINKLAK